jgi:hypothetical protein
MTTPDMEFTAELEDCMVDGIWMILPVEVGVKFEKHYSLVSDGFTKDGDYRLVDRCDIENVIVYIKASQDIKNCDEDGNELETFFARKGDCLMHHHRECPSIQEALEKAMGVAIEDYEDSMADI